MMSINYTSKSLQFSLIDDAIASRAIFVIVSGRTGGCGRRMRSARVCRCRPYHFGEGLVKNPTILTRPNYFVTFVAVRIYSTSPYCDCLAAIELQHISSHSSKTVGDRENTVCGVIYHVTRELSFGDIATAQ